MILPKKTHARRCGVRALEAKEDEARSSEGKEIRGFLRHQRTMGEPTHMHVRLMTGFLPFASSERPEVLTQSARLCKWAHPGCLTLSASGAR